ncbi:hypothetical protein F4824DRAFT_481524 [Ustulina deusta]|nr:hypothetical protein F4824DRAFT_481524 [Ustulina deusta]
MRSSSRLDYVLLLVVLRYGAAVLFRDRDGGFVEVSREPTWIDTLIFGASISVKVSIYFGDLYI